MSDGDGIVVEIQLGRQPVPRRQVRGGLAARRPRPRWTTAPPAGRCSARRTACSTSPSRLLPDRSSTSSATGTPRRSREARDAGRRAGTRCRSLPTFHSVVGTGSLRPNRSARRRLAGTVAPRRDHRVLVRVRGARSSRAAPAARPRSRSRACARRPAGSPRSRRAATSISSSPSRIRPLPRGEEVDLLAWRGGSGPRSAPPGGTRGLGQRLVLGRERAARPSSRMRRAVERRERLRPPSSLPSACISPARAAPS